MKSTSSIAAIFVLEGMQNRCRFRRHLPDDSTTLNNMLAEGVKFPDGTELSFAMTDEIADVCRYSKDGEETEMDVEHWKHRVFKAAKTTVVIEIETDEVVYSETLVFASTTTVKKYVETLLRLMLKKPTDTQMSTGEQETCTYADMLGDHVFYEGLEKMPGRSKYKLILGS